MDQWGYPDSLAGWSPYLQAAVSDAEAAELRIGTPVCRFIGGCGLGGYAGGSACGGR